MRLIGSGVRIGASIVLCGVAWMLQQEAVQLHTWPLALSTPEMLGLPDYAAFNPSIAPHSTGILWLFYRVSNMNFCAPNRHWRQIMQRERRLRSSVAVATLNITTAMPPQTSPGTFLNLTVQGAEAECTEGIDLGGGKHGSFEGAEDPRAIVGVHEQIAPWLLIPIWTDGCSRLRMHLVKLKQNAATEQIQVDAVLPLSMKGWDSEPRIAPNPDTERLQKNWLPFVHLGDLYLEYSIEPRVVLRVEHSTGSCTPLSHPSSTFPYLRDLTTRYSRVSGGAPAVLLSSRGIYLGLAHVKEVKQRPQSLGTSEMVYKHLFYAFKAEHPFQVVAAGQLFTFNSSSNSSNTTVQFSSGMVLDEPRGMLLLTFSELDCGGHIQEFDLKSVLLGLTPYRA